MEQLAEQCIAESLRLGEDEDGLCERLVKANEIIYCAWYSTAPEYATRWQLDKKDEVSPQEQEEIDRTQHILWKRHDPKRSFSEGTRSEHYTNFDKDSLHSTIADYLSRPYLRHPVLDWIFMDMTISREISEFGEALKQSWLPGKRDPLLGVHSRYNKTQGNLAEMTKVDWNDVFGRWNTLFWWTLGFPLAAIWASFHWNYTTVGLSLSGIYATVIIVFMSIKFSRFLVRLIGRLAGKADPRLRVFRLWDQMYEVWRRLEGPVVNPTLVREAMVKSRDQGAVWDTVSWSLIDRVIAIDSAVWIVQQA
jgi:hypothetical protein